MLKYDREDACQMKKCLILSLSLLMLTLLPFTLAGCGNKYDDSLSGVWQVVSFVTEDGAEASVEGDLFLVFYGNGYGATKNREENHNTFQYTARKGNLTRTINYGKGDPETVEETYRFEEDGTLVIISPEARYSPAATMTLKKVETN